MATAGVTLWSTTAASNSSADPAVNWAEGMAPSAVNDSARAQMASTAKWRDDLYGVTSGLTTGGTTTAFTVSTNSTYASAAVMSGAIFTIVMNATSGAAPTLAVDGLTARALNVSTGVAVPTGALISGTPYMVRYVHATTEFIVLNPSIRPNTALDIIGGTQLTAPVNNDTLPIYDLSATANKRILLSDFFTVINDFTADASPDKAADYVVTYDASAATSKKVLLQNLPAIMPRGYIDGCIISNNGANTFDVAAGACRDSTNTVNINVAAMTAKDLASLWAAGSSAGVRETTAIANQTYHIWAVVKSDGTGQDVFASSSTVAATALAALVVISAGYAGGFLRLIGSIIRSAGAILPFVQYGDEFYLTTPTLDINNATPGTSANTATLTVPTGLKVKAFLNINADNGNAVYVSSLDVVDLAPSVSSSPLASIEISGAAQIGGQVFVWTSTSAQARYRATSNAAVRGVTTGWVHPRGRNA